MTVPAAPTGPTPPVAGYRVIFADGFETAGTLDTNLWTPTREFSGANSGSPPWLSNGYNGYEAEVFDSANVSVAGSICTLNAAPAPGGVTPSGGTTGYYTSGVISTANAANAFLFSPQTGGPFYFEARIRIPGDVANTGTSPFPAFWATTVRTYGLSSNDNHWSREMDFFEFTQNPKQIDSVNLYPPGGYGGFGNLINDGAYFQTTLPLDMAGTYHVYTVQVNKDGSFQLWIDGKSQWTLPAHEALDWMCLILNYALDSAPLSGWAGDNMLVDYVCGYQDAAQPLGTGVIGGGIAGGTTVAGGGGGGGGVTYASVISGLSGLQLWLALDETSGTVAKDSSANGWNGTYPGSGVTYSVTNTAAVAGVDSGAVTLAAATTVTVPNHPALRLATPNGTGQWTLLMWVNIGAGVTGYPPLAAMGNSATTGWQLFYDVTGHALGFLVHNVQSAQALAGSILAGWHLIGVTWDGTTVTFYLDGNLVGNDTTAAAQTVTDTSSAFAVGPTFSTDQTIVCSSALPAGTISNIYTSFTSTGGGGGGIINPPPISGVDLLEQMFRTGRWRAAAQYIITGTAS